MGKVNKLAKLQNALPFYYVEMCEWTQTGDIIKAIPKKPLSQAAHKQILKVFKPLGGAYVSNNGKQYFELVTTPPPQTDNPISRAYKQLQKNGLFND